MWNWSQEWKLNLNASKNEVCPYLTWSNDSTWQLALFIGNHKIWVSVTPRLLSAILDRSLTFNAHLMKLAGSLSSSFRIIIASAHTSWGWHCSTLKMAYYALICSKLNYTAPAWKHRSPPKLFSLTHYWPSHVYTIGSLRLGTWRSELPHMHQPINSARSRKVLHISEDYPKWVALAADIPQHL